MSKYQDAIIAVLLIGLAGFFAYETSRISTEYFQRAPGIAYYPLLLSVSLAAASFLLLIRILMRPSRANETPGESRDREGDVIKDWEGAVAGQEGSPENIAEDRPSSKSSINRALPVALGVVILAAYVLALGLFGFVFSTPVMLAALLLAYGVRNWKIIASLSVGTTLLIYFSFYYGLMIQLP